MQISAVQWATLQSNMVEQATLKVVRFIDAACDDSPAYDGTPFPADPAERHALVRALVDRALAYGIDTELGLGQFALLGMAYARNFDESPAARRILTNAERTPAQNVQALMDAVVRAEAGLH